MLPRPIRLLPGPEPIEVIAPVPDDPPQSFRWRRESHKVARAEGPERIAPEWWRSDGARQVRDYYRIEDERGRRFWVYRSGTYGETTQPRWYLHGWFA
jgi:protein ImuB